MPDAQHLLLFVAAGLLLNLTPGVDVFYIVGHALRRGARAGIVAALGITAGCCVHIVAAAAGLSALLAASATAFTVLKWLGAAYLVYLGLRMLLARGGASPDWHAAAGGAQAGDDLRRIFRGGFLTNVLNPKVALFFLAFVPQFIAPDAAHPTLAFLALGLLFNFNALWVCIGWALAAGWLARRAAGGALRWIERAAGALIVGFGLQLAFSDAPTPSH